MNNIIDILSKHPFIPHIISLLIFIFYLVLLRVCHRILGRIQRQILIRIRRDEKISVKGIKIGEYQLLDRSMHLYLFSVFIRVMRILIFTFILIFTLPMLFYLNPPTKIIAQRIIRLILIPIEGVFVSVVAYLPNLITIVVILLTIKYSVKVMRYMAGEISEEKLRIPGFYPEWALPTYNLFKIFLYLLGLIVISPYLPGSGSAAFKGISIFAGLLISLGSSSYVGNMVAGFILTYMRSFQKGDRIRVDDITGDVIERSLLVTKVKTPKNERVTIPNSKILSGSIINYTYSANKYKVIVHTSVTIGYDVDWRIVHRLLTASARGVEGILETPAPFVLQKSLDDFYVSYELNAYTREEKRFQSILSEIHGNIQDNFHRENIEILSPHYRVARNDLSPAIPEEFLKKHK